MTSTGQLLSDRYRILETLGQGGMGTVYLASVEALDGKKVALKELRAEGSEETAVEQFRKEASFLANLRHPRLVAVTDFFSHKGCYYLVMDYVEGEPLSKVLQRTLPSPLQAIDWGLQLCSVLGFLHSQQPPILFRDLKPSNIMLEPAGSLKLIDFGIARRTPQGELTNTFLKGRGSPGYAPLEQYDDKESTDVRSDIYALGATLFHLLTGRVPPTSVARATGEGLPPFPDTVPEQLGALVLKCLKLRPEQRFQTVVEVQEALRSFPGVDTLTVGLDEETVDLPRPAPRRRPWKALLSVGLVLAVLAAAARWADVPQIGPATERIPGTPDLNLSEHPESGPAALAAASGLHWLSESPGFRIGQVRDLPTRLSAPQLLGKEDDLAPERFVQSLRSYLGQVGQSAKLSQTGWRASPSSSLAHKATLDQALMRGAAVWLNLGWYQRNSEKAIWRNGGQWVTVVGLKGETLQVVSPALAQGTREKVHRLRIQPRFDAELLGNEKQLPWTGDVLTLKGDLQPPSGSELVVVDAVVTLDSL